MNINQVLILVIPLYTFYVTILMIMMFLRRVRALKAGNVKLSYFRSYQDKDVGQELVIIQNHFNNQFQIPVYFFITILSFLHFNIASQLTVILAYAFIASRLWHSSIHLGNNNVKLRAISYATGLVILLTMWIQLVCLLFLQ
jgi:hypothetical protein